MLNNRRWKTAIEEIISQPKTIVYMVDTTALQPSDPKDKYLTDQVLALRIDSSDYLVVGFGLQKDSEFLPLFNHYILKGRESGILDRLFKFHHTNMFTKELFGIIEPQPLSYSNIIFLFICLGLGISSSLILAGVEMVVTKRSKMSQLVRNLLATLASRRNILADCPRQLE